MTTASSPEATRSGTRRISVLPPRPHDGRLRFNAYASVRSAPGTIVEQHAIATELPPDATSEQVSSLKATLVEMLTRLTGWDDDDVEVML